MAVFATPDAKLLTTRVAPSLPIYRKELKDDDQWMAVKQVYLNVGNFLLGVAAMGLDAVPIEGSILRSSMRILT